MNLIPTPISILLIRMLKRAGPDGMSKVVNEFTTNHPEISKRQTEPKVFEVAVKEKQHDDTKQVTYLILINAVSFF